MSLMQREKGKRFERQVAADLREALPGLTIHRSSQADRAYHADVRIEDGPPLLRCLWLECQDSRKPTPLVKLAQAELDVARAGGAALAVHEGHYARPALWLPVVVWHRIGERRSQVTMRSITWNWFNGMLDIPAGVWTGVEHLADAVPITLDWEDFLSVLKEIR